VAKSKLNRQMKTELDDGDIPEDVKVKKYNQDLTKFLHTKRKIPNETTSAVAEKDITAPVEENKTIRHIEKSPAATPVSDELVTRRKPVKRLRRALASPLNSSRLSRPKRVRKAPIKFFGKGGDGKLYYEASQPGSYGGVKPLVRYSGSSVHSVKNWLSSQDAYTLHKPIRKKFVRRKTFSKDINDLFQADLADMQNLARYNDNFRYLPVFASFQNLPLQFQ
jgi:hypothetical protein